MNAQKAVQADELKLKFQGDVLLCEDSAFSQMLVKQDLVSLGANVHTCQNGQEAVDIIMKRAKNKKKPFDLVVMNIIMPVMDGLEAAQTLSWRGVKVPMVSFSSNTAPSDLENYESYGMSNHLHKPYSKEEMIACLSKYLRAESL